MANISGSSNESDFYGFEPEDRLSYISDGPDLYQDNLSSSSNSEIEDDTNQTNSNYYYGNNRFKWSKHPPVQKRIPAENIIHESAGPKGPAKNLIDKSPLSIWSLYITDDILNKVVIHTNEQIKLQKVKYKNPESPIYKETNLVELKALVGLLYYSSVFKGNHESIHSLFAKDGTGRDVFRCVMPRNRFTFLLDCMRFDNRETREQRKIDDPAFLISEIFNKFISNSQKCYTMGPNVTIDEMLIPFRGRCKFRIYIPKKPAKYGIKVQFITDASNSYAYFGYIYTGKGSDGFTLSEEDKKFLITTQAVLRLVKSLEKSHRNITADNWYTSVELVQELKKKRSDLCWHLKKE